MQLPGGKRTVFGHLPDRWTERANVARFWKTTPHAMKLLPTIEYQRMREYTIRSIEEQEAAIEAAKMGPKTPQKDDL